MPAISARLPLRHLQLLRDLKKGNLLLAEPLLFFVGNVNPDPKFFSAMPYTYVIESGTDGQWYIEGDERSESSFAKSPQRASQINSL